VKHIIIIIIIIMLLVQRFNRVVTNLRREHVMHMVVFSSNWIFSILKSQELNPLTTIA